VVRRALLALFIVVVIGCAGVSGQQPNRKPEPYVAPLLPADVAWLIALPSPPAAGGAMDDDHVYVPLQPVSTTVDGARVVTPDSAAVVALVRGTGQTRWTVPIESSIPPVVDQGRVIVAAATDLLALDADSGKPLWSMPLGGRVRGPMLVRGNLVVALLDPDELIAVRLDTREVAWRAMAGAKATLMNADDRGVYVTTADSRIVGVRLGDGSVAWQRQLEGTLGQPAVGRDRVLVGSDRDSLWALDPESGDGEWTWRRGVFGGDVLGAVVDGDVAYVVSLDNIVRALNRSDGSQLWKRALTTRPIHPPRAFFGTVVVVGLAPPVSTFLAKTGAAVSTWVAPPPADAELQGPPLIDEHLKPFGVAMVVILRDGRVLGMRPTAMTFPESPIIPPLKTIPGRVLPPERFPGAAAPEPPPASTDRSR
jgi:outer membrane protein assembly factor BamB